VGLLGKQLLHGDVAAGTTNSTSLTAEETEKEEGGSACQQMV